MFLSFVFWGLGVLDFFLFEFFSFEVFGCLAFVVFELLGFVCFFVGGRGGGRLFQGAPALLRPCFPDQERVSDPSVARIS